MRGYLSRELGIVLLNQKTDDVGDVWFMLEKGKKEQVPLSPAAAAVIKDTACDWGLLPNTSQSRAVNTLNPDASAVRAIKLCTRLMDKTLRTHTLRPDIAEANELLHDRDIRHAARRLAHALVIDPPRDVDYAAMRCYGLRAYGAANFLRRLAADQPAIRDIGGVWDRVARRHGLSVRRAAAVAENLARENVFIELTSQWPRGGKHGPRLKHLRRADAVLDSHAQRLGIGLH